MQPREVFFESLECIEAAAKLLGYKSKRFSDAPDILIVEGPNQTFRFFRNKHPFNNSMANQIGRGKYLQLSFYKNYNLPHPKTLPIFNPNSKHTEPIYLLQSDPLQIIQELNYPFILKKSVSSFSRHVHLVKNINDAKKLFEFYFSTDKHLILLAQEYIVGTEYRLISVAGKLKLAYQKRGNSRFDPNFDKDKLLQAPKVTDKALLAKFELICQQVAEALDINFAGIDVMVDDTGLVKIIETNASPTCYFYNQANGQEDFIQVYLELLDQNHS
jgi:glutathione synthase/RimK-type ligase-like ATP-grasp enzyme